MFYGASVVGVAPDKKSVSPPAKSERECIKLRITTNRTLTAHAHYNGTPCWRCIYVLNRLRGSRWVVGINIWPKNVPVGSLDPFSLPRVTGLTVVLPEYSHSSIDPTGKYLTMNRKKKLLPSIGLIYPFERGTFAAGVLQKWATGRWVVVHSVSIDS